jgi:hypothetical protein
MSELSLGELVDGLVVFTVGPVLGGAVCPGLLLCVPGILLVVVPVVVLAVLALVLGAVVMTPYLLVRALRGPAISLVRAAQRRPNVRSHGA